MNGKVLVIAPHADDEVLGVGGTIAKHVANGDEVSVVIVADRKCLALEQRIQAKEAKKILGYSELFFLGLKDEYLDGYIKCIIDPLEEIYNSVCPNTVYTCHKGDINQDHRAVFQASTIACRVLQEHSPKRLISYEVPSSTQQGLMEPFVPNFYNKLSPEELDAKIEAFVKYEDETRPLPNPRNEDGLANFAIQRGMECGGSFAEAFIILREIT